MWTCPKCGAKVDPGFDVCWQCGTNQDGVEDPTFVRADDTPPIQDSLYDPIAEPDPTILGPTPDSPAMDVVECYQANDLMEAKFLADQLTAEGIPAMSDTQDLQEALGTWEGNPRVYCHAGDLARARAWLQAYEQRRRSEHGRTRENV